MKNKTFVVCNTKGGVGKTIMSTMILPIIFAEDNVHINIYEIDNNNKSKLNNSSINFKSIQVNKADEIINSVYFDLLSASENINIIDAGGGDDSIYILEYLKKADFKNLIYLVPINSDLEQLQNAQQTISSIKTVDMDAKIYLILNRCISLQESSIKNQFINIFGSKKYGIPSSIKSFEEIEILFVPDSPIFGILKNIYQTSLFDFSSEAEDLITNIAEYRLGWIKKGKEAFDENMQRYTFAKDVIELKNQLQSFNILKDL